MKKKSAANGVVIKSLGKTSGNIDSVKLRSVIRELQAAPTPAAKAGPIRIEDTASGSGAIRFSFADGATAPRRKRQASA
jgi:hypothetical protein